VRFLLFILVIFILMGLVLPVAALSTDDLTFYASFDSSISADISKGDGKPLDNVLTSGFEFTDGIFGKAVVAGSKDRDLAYAVAGNMDDTRGTVSFWIKPIDWKLGDSRQHVFMQIPGRMAFYNYWQSATSGFYWMTGSTIIWGPGGVYGGIEPGKWHHLAVTWGDRKAAMYVDGAQVSEAIDMPTEFPRWNDSNRLILSDPSWTSDKTNRTAIDELMIFNRPLDPAEIKSLYRRGAAPLLQPTASIPKVLKGVYKANAAILTDFVDGLFGNLSDRYQAQMNWDEKSIYVKLSDTLKKLSSSVKTELSLTDASGALHSFTLPFAGSIAVKWSDLGYKHRPESIGFDLIVRYGSGFGDYVRWAGHRPDSIGRLILVDSKPYMRLLSLGRLNWAQLDARAIIINSSAKQMDIQARLQPSDFHELVDPVTFTRSDSGLRIILDRKLKLSKSSIPLQIKSDFADTDINSFLLQVKDSKGGIIYQSQRSFVAAPPLIVSAKTLPEHNRVDIVLDSSKYRGSRENLSAKVVLVDQTGKTLTSINSKLTGVIRTVSLPLNNLPTGKIRVSAVLLESTKPVSSFTTTFTKIVPREWTKHRLGIDDIVIRPFTEIKISGQSISVWGRTYTWSNSLFPTSITSAGQELLYGPIELYSRDTPTGIVNPAKVSVTYTSKTRIVLRCESKIGDVQIIATHTIEQDGMLLTNLKITGKPLGLALVTPLKTQQISLYQYWAAGDDISKLLGASGNVQLGFMNTLWLGNEDRGLEWFAENPQGWRFKGNSKPIGISVSGNRTSFTLQFSSKDSAPAGDRITFGFIPTPVKPLPENWRFYRCKRDWGYQWFMGFTASNNYISKPNPDFARVMKTKKTPIYVPYQRPDWINTHEPECDYYKEEWQAIPAAISGSDDGSSQRHLSVCLGSKWVDFMLHYAVKAYDNLAMDGYYFDGALPTRCKNTNHGHGWITETGEIGSTYPILAYREFYKRLALEFQKRSRPSMIWAHMSNSPELPTLSFCDMLWNGEQFSGSATPARDYSKVMSMGYFRAQFLGQQYGLPTQWLVEFMDSKGAEPIGRKEIDTVLLFSLVHGIGDLTLAANLGSGDNYDYILSVLDKQDKWGVREKDCKFTGYWKQDIPVIMAPADPNLVCSIWSRPGKALLVLSNATGKDVDALVEPDLATLGISGKVKVSDLHSGEIIPFVDYSMHIRIPSSSWREIEITQ